MGTDDFFAAQKSARSKMDDPSDQEESKMKIYLKMTKDISLEVKSSDTIGAIKNKVLMTEGVSEHNQELVFAGNHLVDTKTLADHNISADSTIELLIRDDMHVHIKLPSMGKAVMLRVERSATTLHLKVKIQEMEGIDVRRQTLIYLGRVLADDDNLFSNEIRDNSTLNMVLHPVTDFWISISLASGKTSVLEARSWYTIWEVKNIIETLVNIRAHQQKLIFAGMVLDDNLTLLDCKVTEDSTLHLIECMQIFIKTSQKILTLVVDKNNTIAMVMKKIEKKLGFQLKHQVLNYAGKYLEDDKSLGYYQIEDESTLHLNVRFSNMWEKDRILILLDYGVVVSVQAHPLETIKDIKVKIRYFAKVSLLELYSIPGRRKLHDGSTLEKSRIEFIMGQPVIYAETFGSNFRT